MKYVLILKNYGYVSSISKKTTLEMKIAEIVCMLMKAAHVSNFDLVIQTSHW